MLMRLSLCSRFIAVLENPHSIVLEDDLVLIRIGSGRVRALVVDPPTG